MLAFALITAFLVSSAWAETAGDAASIARVKAGIAWGLLVLVPALAATGASGFLLAGGQPKGMAAVKLRRMRFVAANGILVLAPAAVFLALRASAGAFDMAFAIVQAMEFIAGGINLALIGLNIRDGLRMSGRMRRRQAPNLVR